MKVKKILKQTLAGVLVAGLLLGQGEAFAAPKKAKELLETYKKNSSEQEMIKDKLEKMPEKIRAIENSLVKTGEEILKTQEDLKKAEADRDHRQKLMEKRIQATYERNKNSTFENFLTSKSLAEALRKAEYVSAVQSYDQKQMQALKKACDNVENLKKTLESQQKALAKEEENLQKEQEKLTKLLKEREEDAEDLKAHLREALVSEARAEGVLPKGDEASQEAILKAAESQLGVPYVWGGTSPGSGLDCSGFVQYCYRCAGISLPRVAADQGICGQATTDPEPGDMVCYGTHIGIYIGNGKMIHAPQPGDVVRVANVYGDPWYMRAW